GGRTVLTELNGTISDGPSNYPENTQCEWLIKAPRPNMTITLNFLEYGTECTYDYLFIHDGPSYISPLLASLSGEQLPGKVIAHSGQMLLNLYSDTNYVLKGFTANYSIANCTNGCSGHGACDSGVCQCQSQWHGVSCNLPWCPDNCNQGSGQGFCNNVAGFCACAVGYTGDSCSLSLLNNTGDNMWYPMVTESAIFTPRTSFGGVYFNSADSIYIFGGFNLNKIFDDILEFNISSGQWRKIITSDPKPMGRHSHTVSLYKDSLLVFGGDTGTGLSNELWQFNLTSRLWAQLAVSDPNTPPPVVDHTANIVGDKLYVYGGRTANTSFSSAMFMYSLSPGGTWSEVVYKSGKLLSLEVAGHSTVYHSDTNSLIVFGGFMPLGVRASERSNKLSMFHLDELVWTELKTDGANLPTKRAFHSAILSGDYLVVFGGNRHTHGSDETCYDGLLHFYHIPCHKWVPFLAPPSGPRGRFSHLGLVRDSVMMVLGGYAGMPLGDMMSYKLPQGVAVVNQTGRCWSHCKALTSDSSCKLDPACGWCSGNPASKCFAVQESSKCLSGWSTGTCPGSCSVHDTCKSCLAWGVNHVPHCGWCVQDSLCYPTSSPSGACKAPFTKGWWGTSSQFLTSSVNQCRSLDFPPGLVEVSHTYPVNLSNPDFERVAECPTTAQSLSCLALALRNPSSAPLFPSPSEDRKYFVNLQVTRLLNGMTAKTNCEVTWDGYQDPNFPRLVSENLEPFSSGGSGCSSFHSCMQCMTDRSCGWCEVTRTCMSRVSGAACQDNSGRIRHLNLNYTECVKCDDHKDCITCNQDTQCEWNRYRICLRRNVIPSADVRTQCGKPCSRRQSCTECVSDSSGCSWCDSASECFVFASYISRYPLGTCTHWVDSPSGKCRDCTVHKTCSSCLSDIKCGWCSNGDNPLLGRCYSGDFRGPHGSQCSSSAINVTGSTTWAYDKCPDVNECRLGLDSCHYNSTCVNTYGTYHCICNPGYTGDGKTACNKTCYPACVHGTCNSNYLCDCDLGWLGTNCTIDCGCNGHSSCDQGIGICDQCQDYTHGNHCELCVPGSYGNATTSQGCKACDCNGHGDVTLGVCDRMTGQCFCKDNTEGLNCERCKSGLVGNPRYGGRCYYECKSRSILTNVTQGDISTAIGDGVTPPSRAGCVWVISASHNTSHSLIYEPPALPPQTSDITLTFTNLSLNCLTDHVTIYDGLPPFILGLPTPSPLRFYKLGSFCSALSLQQSVVASLGNMVVVFKGDISAGSLSKGFGAIFSVRRCADHCHGNRRCVMTSQGEACRCASDWTGPDCTIRVCPNNCSGHGSCNSASGLCTCAPGYAGTDCSLAVPYGKGQWELLSELTSRNRSTSSLVRMAHSLVTSGQSLWVFGGYSMAYGPLGDIMKFDLVTMSWSQVVTNQLAVVMPTPRYFHCAVIHAVSVLCSPQGVMVVFGGLTEQGVSNEVWHLSLSPPSWTRKEPSTPGIAVAGHTCTLVGDVITVIGGYDPGSGFNGRVYQYHVINQAWSIMDPLGSQPAGLYGHSAVYHASTQSILVFGGYLHKSHRVTVSDELYSLHLPSRRWSLLQALPGNQVKLSAPLQAMVFYRAGNRNSKEKNSAIRGRDIPYPARPQDHAYPQIKHGCRLSPSPKFFHSAVVVNDTMVVYGGRADENTISDELLVYKISCNFWHNMRAKGSAVLGVAPGPVFAAASSIVQDKIYLFGGSHGYPSSSLSRFTIPTDLCQGLLESMECISAPGCNWCEVNNTSLSLNQSSAVKKSVCYPIGSPTPTISKHRACASYNSCASCLGRYPGSPTAENRCSWCVGCPAGGTCVAYGTSCSSSYPCDASQTSVTDAGNCLESTTQCARASCADCTAGSCVWTSQLKWITESKQQFYSEGVGWGCFSTGVTASYPSMSVSVTQSSACPSNCSVHTDCASCLSSKGGEGGWLECVWSVSLGKCYPPSYLPLLGVSGGAGRILRGSSQSCLPSCLPSNQCSKCLKSHHCAWCSEQGSNGIGVCMEGSLTGPQKTNYNVTTHITTPAAPIWASLLCPLENECLNGRHNCSALQNCVDTPEFFRCVCKPGYEQALSGQCVPVCTQGCVNGKCTSPDVCTCSFGWTGPNCSVECLCNGHGHCANATKRDVCTDCRNHTTGSSCQYCEPLYVGDARNNGSCVSCYHTCNHTATVCMDRKDLERARNFSLSLDPDQVVQWLTRGPLVIDEDGECLCGNFSTGLLCKHCVPGHFFLQGYCSRCQCNGHGSICDERGKCSCENNTAEQCHSGQNDCYKNQCTKCVDGFLGSPADSRLCYSKINHMQEFFISNDPTKEINDKNVQPLSQGLTVPYVVFPKYTNVDIRTTIDVFRGGLDVYITPDNRAVSVYESNLTHVVEVNSESSRRRRRSADSNLNIKEINAGPNRLNTFVTFSGNDDVTVVRSVEKRLIITFPYEEHLLRSVRFYLVFRGVGSSASPDTTGVVYFRQDVSNIDLFVFFSVFFSVFFLVLSICVITWKMKQFHDRRRIAQVQERELETMASRPFASYSFIVDTRGPPQKSCWK
ncbi:predicted protein, partial [Nematostella vectensis]